MPGARGDQAGPLRLEAQGAERPRSRGRRARAADPGGPRVGRGHPRRAEGAHGASAPQAGAAPDLVGRDFTADGPDRARFDVATPS